MLFPEPPLQPPGSARLLGPLVSQDTIHLLHNPFWPSFTVSQVDTVSDGPLCAWPGRVQSPAVQVPLVRAFLSLQIEVVFSPLITFRFRLELHFRFTFLSFLWPKKQRGVKDSWKYIFYKSLLNSRSTKKLHLFRLISAPLRSLGILCTHRYISQTWSRVNASIMFSSGSQKR